MADRIPESNELLKMELIEARQELERLKTKIKREMNLIYSDVEFIPANSDADPDRVADNIKLQQIQKTLKRYNLY